jgi:hypothetical protein
VHAELKLVRRRPQRDLCEDLVREGARHDERRMASSTAR